MPLDDPAPTARASQHGDGGGGGSGGGGGGGSSSTPPDNSGSPYCATCQKPPPAGLALRQGLTPVHLSRF